MADNVTDEDDDESFGDFTFASFPPSTSYSVTANAVNDDDWGDFVNHSSPSAQINGGFAKPYDPFGSSSLDPSAKRTTSHINDDDNVKNGVAVRPSWKKPQGAIPLSIFGEEEEEEEQKEEREHSAIVFSNENNGDSAKKGSDSNGSIGINDLFSSLYNQSNGSVSKSSVAASASAAPTPNSNGSNNLNSDSVDAVDEDDDDGWEFQAAEWETGTKSQNVKDEVPKHDNGAVDVGAKLDSSTRISDKAGAWYLGFEFSPGPALQNHTSPQLGRKSESNETKAGYLGFGFGSSLALQDHTSPQLSRKSELNENRAELAAFNQNFGELKSAHSWPNFGELNSGHSWPGSNQMLDAPKMADAHRTNVEVLKFDGGAPHSTIGPSLASESHQSNEWGFSLSFNSGSPGKDIHVSESYIKTNSNHDDNNNSNASPTNTNVDSNVNLFESKIVDIEIGTKDEKSQISSENRREALPLSIFGDEMPDTEELSQDLSPYAPTSPIKNNFNSPGSNLSIDDIWNLYSQAETKSPPNVTPKANENVINASPGVSGSNLAIGDDDFDDDFWDYKDASPGTTFAHDSAQKLSFNQAPHVTENGLHSSPTDLKSDLINGDDGFEDDSWEFKDATSRTRSQDLTSAIDHRDSPRQLSTKLEPLDYVDFYNKLKDEFCNAVLFHLQKLKKAQSAAALAGEDAKEKALGEEIQEFSEIMHQDNIIPNEYLSENYSPRSLHFAELLELLKEPKFQSLESEYQLSSKLSMAEKDMESAMVFLKDAVSTLRILKSGSGEEQSDYLARWSQIASVCSQELKHGANIWKQAVQKNVHSQILSNPKGVRYIHALGEVYRVAEIIGASAKFYKPWMLLGSIDATSLFAHLNECYSTWASSGLEEALFNISNQNNFEPDGSSRELVESIKYIHELEEHALHSYVISGEETTCQLSALPDGFIPGLKMVTWNGKHYLVKLANLWVNLISSDPPKK